MDRVGRHVKHGDDHETAWRAAWRRRPAVERWLISILASLASGLGRLAFVSMRGLAWRLAAGAIGIAGMGWLLTDATRALMAEAPAGALSGAHSGAAPASLAGSIAENPAMAPVAQGLHAPAAARNTAVTGAIAAGARAAAPDWIAEQPRRMGFEFRLREVQGEAVHHAARRERHSGAREEIVTAGRFDGDGPWLVMSLARTSEPPARLAVTLARRASERGIALARSASPGALATKFGPIEAADITLGGAPFSADALRTDRTATGRACIGFRHAPDDVALTITGWFCGTDARPADRAALACLIERVGIAATGDDAALRQHFARAELNRQSSCNPAHLHTAGRRTTWLDPTSTLPPLRRGAT
jgi:hypothetical protein